MADLHFAAFSFVDRITAFEPALVFAFGSMLCYAIFMLLTRYLANTLPGVDLTRRAHAINIPRDAPR